MAGEGVRFEWGEKKGRGKGADAQFYASFTFDGVKYSLFDCVYLYKEGEPEPYIGKLIKMWEQTGNRRRVKILWFFRPIEIRNFLGEDAMPKINELFLACGDGVGLTDINTPECIAGKCRVICTSKDQRNRQPSDEELKEADYIFYRTFDVGSCTLSDQFGETVGGVEAKYIFNFFLADASACDANAKSSLNGLTAKTPQNPSLSLEATKAKGRKDLKRALSPVPLDDRKSKKLGISDASRTQKSTSAANGLEEKAQAVTTELSFEKPRTTLGNKSPPQDDGGLMERPNKSSGRNKGGSEEMPGESTPDLSVEKKRKAPELLEVPRRPKVESSKYFAILPWETRILEAQQHGTLVLLENFDVVHTSEEIEDMVYFFFQKQCTGRVIERSMYSGPYLGRALIICKNRGDAEEIVKRLKEKVLMLSNGRPLTARVMPSRRMRDEPAARKFFGHYGIEKMRSQAHREEAKKTVSTSHCAQQNTLEYELADDWIELHSRQTALWNMLHDEHEAEAKKAWGGVSPTPTSAAAPTTASTRMFNKASRGFPARAMARTPNRRR